MLQAKLETIYMNDKVYKILKKIFLSSIFLFL